MLKIAAITCGRNDYSIYYPLLKKLKEDNFFDIRLIAGGTHLSPFHGNTIEIIRKDGFKIDHEVESLILGDSEESISTSMGTTLTKFSSIWKTGYDLIFALGDRYEMFAAVAASVPFNIPVAHFHGGETTLGAIDNKFRHAISSMASMHFVSAQPHFERVSQIIGSEKNVYYVGALALDNIKDIDFFTSEEFENRFGFSLDEPFVLFTFHPETVSLEKNLHYITILEEVLVEIEMPVLITMPNADSLGGKYRQSINNLVKKNKHIFSVESLGLKGYFTAMKRSAFLLGNTSSGIIEAASFNKYVIDIGKRQEGRYHSDNVFHVEVDKNKIISKIKDVIKLGTWKGTNPYFQGGASEKIIKILKKELL